jgi:hypothetical protein
MESKKEINIYENGTIVWTTEVDKTPQEIIAEKIIELQASVLEAKASIAMWEDWDGSIATQLSDYKETLSLLQD